MRGQTKGPAFSFILHHTDKDSMVIVTISGIYFLEDLELYISVT